VRWTWSDLQQSLIVLSHFNMVVSTCSRAGRLKIKNEVLMKVRQDTSGLAKVRMLAGSTRIANLKLVQVNKFTQSDQQLGGSAVIWTWVQVRFTTQCCWLKTECWMTSHRNDTTISVWKAKAYWQLSSLPLQLSTKLQSTLQASVQLL